MAVALSREINLSPMSRICVFKKPFNGSLVDLSHFQDCVIEFALCGRSGSFPEVIFELRMFITFAEVIFQVLETITVGTGWKYVLYTPQ